MKNRWLLASLRSANYWLHFLLVIVADLATELAPLGSRDCFLNVSMIDLLNVKGT